MIDLKYGFQDVRDILNFTYRLIVNQVFFFFEMITYIV